MRTHDCEAPMRDAVRTPLLLAASTLLRIKLEWAADHAPPLVRLSGESLWGGSRSAFWRMHQALSSTCAASASAPRTHIIRPPFGLGATLNRRRLRNGHPSCRKDHRPKNFAPELDPRGSREKLRGDRCTEHLQEPQTELHCENNKTGWDIPWKVIVDRQKGGDPCFSTSINKKAVGHLSLEQPIRHLWMPTRGREPGQNHLSSFLISSMHDDGGSQMPGAGRHRHKQTMDTGQQGAIFPAQRTCGPPPALFAARMPGSFDVESCQMNASCHPWTSFPPREFTRLSTYLLGEFSPHARMP